MIPKNYLRSSKRCVQVIDTAIRIMTKNCGTVVQKKEEIQRAENEKKELDYREKHHMVTTGFQFEGYEIVSYLGIVAGEVVLGTGFLSEFTSSFADFFGVQSGMFEEKLETARHAAMDKLIKKSAALGGNAVIGIDIDYNMFSNNVIGVIANGTSVVIRKIR